MWEYYVSIYNSFYPTLLCLAMFFFAIGVSTFLVYPEEHAKVWIICFVAFIILLVTWVILPNERYAKNKACKVEKVEYLCEGK